MNTPLSHRFPLLGLLVVVFLAIAQACGGDDPTEPASRPICFTVSGFNVSVANMWRLGGSYQTNVQGLASFNETVSQSGETHTLVWTNIVNNYTSFVVTSFSVAIDGRSYSYPANRCS